MDRPITKNSDHVAFCLTTCIIMEISVHFKKKKAILNIQVDHCIISLNEIYSCKL